MKVISAFTSETGWALNVRRAGITKFRLPPLQISARRRVTTRAHGGSTGSYLISTIQARRPTLRRHGGGQKDNAVAGYAVGDIVEFIGTKHYTNANASSGKPCKAGKAKITQIYKSGKHQYHLVKVSGGGSTVYGWVDAQDISGGTSAQKIMVGSKVRVKAGAKTYSGGSLASFVYSRDHIVKELSGKRAVITYGGTVVAAVNVDDLTLIYTRATHGMR